MKNPKQKLPNTEFWATQILWFILMFIIAAAAVTYWWHWGVRWIEAGGTAVVPMAALAIMTAEMWAIVYFKISVPEDEEPNSEK